MAFKNDNFYFFELSNMKEFMYWWMLLFMPVVCFVLFLFSIRSVFLLKSWPVCILILLGVLLSEYFLYTYLASSSDLYNGIYNGILSIFFFMLLFYKKTGRRIRMKLEGT